MYFGKYEWAGNPDEGDCTMRILSAVLDYDDGEWECQVTASDFATQDALTSRPAKLVVRGNKKVCLVLIYSLNCHCLKSFQILKIFITFSFLNPKLRTKCNLSNLVSIDLQAKHTQPLSKNSVPK